MVTVASRDLAVRRRKVSPTSTGNVSGPLLQRCAGDPETIEPIFRDETMYTLEGSSEFVPAPQDQGGWNVILAWSERATGVSSAKESKNSWTLRIDGGAQGASPEVQGGGRAPLGHSLRVGRGGSSDSAAGQLPFSHEGGGPNVSVWEVVGAGVLGSRLRSWRGCVGGSLLSVCRVWVCSRHSVSGVCVCVCVCQCFGDKGSARSLR